MRFFLNMLVVLVLGLGLVSPTVADVDPNNFTTRDGINMLKALPDYPGTGPRIFFQQNGSYWYADPNAREVIDELVRICGGTEGNPSYLQNAEFDVVPRNLERQLAFAQQGVPICLQFTLLGGFDIWRDIEKYDPNYYHDVPDMGMIDPNRLGTDLPTYWLHATSRHGKTRLLYCPGRKASRRQIARWLEAGRKMSSYGFTPNNIKYLWIHDETAYKAHRAGWYFTQDMYNDAASTGSADEHDRKLSELHADLVHAFLRGLGAEKAGDLNRDGVEDEADLDIWRNAVDTQDSIGDFNNDGAVNFDDLLEWNKMPKIETITYVNRFWWSGGWRYDPVKDVYNPSPWLPTPLTVPHQTYLSSGNYATDENALMQTEKTITYNLEIGQRPVVMFYSLTYDGTVKWERGVDPALNRAKASLAAKYDCPIIYMYALNYSAGWMTPPLYKKMFEAIVAIVDGSRDRYLTTTVWPDDDPNITLDLDLGEISVEPNQAHYPVNSQVTVTATPVGNARFVKWHNLPEGLDANQPVVTLVMDTNKDITAQFQSAECGSGTAVAGGAVALIAGGVIAARRRKKAKSKK